MRLVTCLALFVSAAAWAQDADPVEPADPAESSPSTEGILPIPDYTLAPRGLLLGDLNGARTDLANRGIQFNVEWTQTLQSVVDGGRDTDTEYGGSLDYNLNLDLQKMGILPGALVNIRAESRYGDDVNTAAGPPLPVNTDSFFPLSDDDDIPFTITNLNYTQFLAPGFGVVMGKLDTLDGDPNEFASGRGVSQFQNAPFIFNPVAALFMPYSTLAVGAFWLPTPMMQLSTTVMNVADSSTTTGFDDFGEGWLWATELRFQYKLGELPGGQTVAFMLVGDAEFAELGNFYVDIPGTGISPSTTDDSWAVTWNAWQYLSTEEPAPDGPLNLLNRVPDLQGWGLFARAGIGDDDTNPLDWNVSLGVGGRGVIPGRDDDVFGAGFFYTDVQEGELFSVLGVDDRTYGFEGFYNIALTPAAFLTLDAQIVETPFSDYDTATILGLRLHVRF
jgi:porin